MRKKLGVGIAGVLAAAVLVIGVVFMLPSTETDSAAGEAGTAGAPTASTVPDRIGAAVNGAGSPNTHEPHPNLRPSPNNKLPAPPPGMNGCDPGYGSRGQCMPWHIPPQEQDRCGWLKRDKSLSALKVNGNDRLAIDRNNDGVACGAGD